MVLSITSTLLVCQQLSDRNRMFLRIFLSVLTIKFWHRHFQKGYLKCISKLLEKFVTFERKIEIISPENIEKITQFRGAGQQWSDTKVVVRVNGIGRFKTSISKHYRLCFRWACPFLNRLLVSFFVLCAIYYDTPSPDEIDTNLACAEKLRTILWCPITAGLR